MRYCKSCGNEIPAGRLKALPNTYHCVECSEVDKWSAVHVIHHKTGNEIEVVKNSETAKEFKRMTSRSTYGAIRGLNSKGSLSYGKMPKLIDTATEEMYNKIGERAMELYELCGRTRAERYVKEFVDSRVLSDGQGKRIIKTILAVHEPNQNTTGDVKVVSKYSPYSKYEPKKSKPIVSDDIMYVFHNWKK